MPLIIVRNDITKMPVDAIVNAAKESLLGGGGVDGCIHRAAGPELLAECRRLGGCKTGDAKITKAYLLPCRYVIHTVGPVWRGGGHGEREQLASCYRTSLALAQAHECETVAFPLISSGIFGYPKDQALRVAADTIGQFLLGSDMTVYLVIFDRKAYQISGKLFADIAEYIDDHYVDAHTDTRRERLRRSFDLQSQPLSVYEDAAPQYASASVASGNLDDLLAHLDAGFSETLLKLIDRSGKKDSEIYKYYNRAKLLLTIKLSVLFYNDLTSMLNGWHGREGEHIWRMSLFMSPRQNAIVRIVQGPLRKPVSCSGRGEFLHSLHLSEAAPGT